MGSVRRWTARAAPLLLVIYACGGGGDDGTGPGDEGDAGAGEAPVTSGSWYRPAPTVTWMWQLTGTVDTQRDVALYDVDLVETPAATLAELKARGVAVLCYFSAGSWEQWRPDAGAFPEATRGKALDGWEGERWLDIRSESVFAALTARLDLARSRGCDGVEPDNVDGFINDTGFPLTADDQLVFNRRLANEAHRRNLAVALKNDGDQAALSVDYYDLALNEECNHFNECGQFAPFVEKGKPVLNAEYAGSLDDGKALANEICAAAAAAGLRTVVFPLALDGSWDVPCWEN